MSLKKDFILPIIVLSVICLLVSGALTVVNYFTEPVIKDAEEKRAVTAMKEIISNADGFEILIMDNPRFDNIPKNVTEIYRTTNNLGFIFMVTSHGYGGDIKLICGITPDGKVIRTAVLSHNETQGLGTPIFEPSHAGQYWNNDRNGIESITAISGATITSNAYKNGIRDAFTAFEIIKNINWEDKL